MVLDFQLYSSQVKSGSLLRRIVAHGLCGYYITFLGTISVPSGDVMSCLNRDSSRWSDAYPPFFIKGLPCIECLAEASEELYDYLPEDKRGSFK